MSCILHREHVLAKAACPVRYQEDFAIRSNADLKFYLVQHVALRLPLNSVLCSLDAVACVPIKHALGLHRNSMT